MLEKQYISGTPTFFTRSSSPASLLLSSGVRSSHGEPPHSSTSFPGFIKEACQPILVTVLNQRNRRHPLRLRARGGSLALCNDRAAPCAVHGNTQDPLIRVHVREATRRRPPGGLSGRLEYPHSRICRVTRSLSLSLLLCPQRQGLNVGRSKNLSRYTRRSNLRRYN